MELVGRQTVKQRLKRWTPAKHLGNGSWCMVKYQQSGVFRDSSRYLGQGIPVAGEVFRDAERRGNLLTSISREVCVAQDRLTPGTSNGKR